MCGIGGCLHFDNSRPVAVDCLEKMAKSLIHRGPDGEGVYVNNNAGLVHRRLAIIDVSSGHQPMLNDDSSVALVFNGEIYNYIELREELKSHGHIFRTSSDTEVLLKAYEEWDIDLHSRLNGMWAFALWDSRKQRLFLSRDRIGEKPLHYAIFNNETFIFGSEIKTLIAFGHPCSVNLEVIELYLSLGYVPAPFSFYRNVRKLLPGHYLLVENSTVMEKRYWDFPQIDEREMVQDRVRTYQHFEELLRNAVQLRMRSDVPFGAFLSGGLDSASIVALMSEISAHPVETFTIGFNEKGFDERALAREVAQGFKTNHHEETVLPDSLEEGITTILRHHDEPFGDSSALPTGLVSRLAAGSVKMVLTGDGGDEVLSGYNGYQSEKFYSFYRMIPRLLRSIPEICLETAAFFSPACFRHNLSRYKNVLATSGMGFKERLLTKASWADKELIRNLVRPDTVAMIRPEDYLSDVMQGCRYRDGFYQLMYYNLKLSLPEDMLVKVDRMSMSHSLESRLPFLDHRLIEFMVTVNKDIKMQGYERKSVLRHTIGKKLPSNLLKAPKQGFVTPLREWFKDKRLTGVIRDRLYSCPLNMDRRLIDTILEDNLMCKADYGNFLWMLLILDRWLRNF